MRTLELEDEDVCLVVVQRECLLVPRSVVQIDVRAVTEARLERLRLPHRAGPCVRVTGVRGAVCCGGGGGRTSWATVEWRYCIQFITME